MTNYYGSDLNKFIDEKCSHKMTCINIDCLLVKVSKNRVRIIESKHRNELLPRSQMTALKILQYITRLSKNGKWRIEYFVVRGNYPFYKFEIMEIGSNKKWILSQKQLVDWLKFEKELSQSEVKSWFT